MRQLFLQHFIHNYAPFPPHTTKKTMVSFIQKTANTFYKFRNIQLAFLCTLYTYSQSL